MLPHDWSQRYCAQLLRYWQESQPDGHPPIWRFSLEDVHTGVRRGFADLDALFAFLQADIAPHTPDRPGGTRQTER